jgi:hypothetical protein
MWTAIAALAGLATTLFAYFINPSRRKTEELNNIFKELEILYVKRDVALEKNDFDTISYVTARIIVLRGKKDNLLK